MLAPKLSHREALSAGRQNTPSNCIWTRQAPLAEELHGIKMVRVLEVTACYLLKGGQNILIEDGVPALAPPS